MSLNSYYSGDIHLVLGIGSLTGAWNCKKTPGIPLSPNFPNTCHHTQLLQGSWELNSSSHACVASTLPTKTSPLLYKYVLLQHHLLFIYILSTVNCWVFNIF